MSTSDGRCGHETESDAYVDGICCWRPDWNGHDRCIWHAEVPNKPVDDFELERTEGPERLDGAVLTDATVGDAITLSDCVLTHADLSGGNFRRGDLAEAFLFGADCSGANFGYADLTGTVAATADFADARLPNADLTGGMLRRADLSGADLSNATLRNADLREANLSGADLSNATLTRVDLRGADLDGADLNGATLTHADVRGTDLSGVTLAGAILRSLDGTDADLSGVDLTEVNAAEATLAGATMREADLTGADLSEATLTEADLTDATLAAVDGTQVDLSGATLSGGSIREADLTGADLSEAALPGVDLFSVDLTGANLAGAQFHADFAGEDHHNADFREADLYRPDFTGADLWRADFGDADLPDAVFDDANCRHANFRGANLEYASFRNADLRGTDLEEANCNRVDFTGARANDDTAFEEVPEDDEYPVPAYPTDVEERGDRERKLERLERAVGTHRALHTLTLENGFAAGLRHDIRALRAGRRRAWTARSPLSWLKHNARVFAERPALIALTGLLSIVVFSAVHLFAGGVVDTSVNLRYFYQGLAVPDGLDVSRFMAILAFSLRVFAEGALSVVSLVAGGLPIATNLKSAGPVWVVGLEWALGLIVGLLLLFSSIRHVAMHAHGSHGSGGLLGWLTGR